MAGLPLERLVDHGNARVAIDDHNRSIGLIEQLGQIVLDLGKKEDNFGQADMPLGFVPRTGEIVLLQMDGDMTREEFQEAMKMAMTACQHIHGLQQDALRRRYAMNFADMENGEAE